MPRFEVDEITDEELMRRFCESLDEEVFRALASRFHASALRRAKERLGDEHLAQDAVQETLIRLVRHRRRYDPARPFAPWFFAVLRHACDDLHRRETRQNRLLRFLAANQPSEAAGGAEADRRAELLECLAALPQREGRLLRLRYLDGLTFKELGERLGCSFEAAKKRVLRLRALLRQS